MKYPRRYRCGICKRRYAVLNSTLHVSSSYRVKFCRECTDLLLIAIRKLGRTLDKDES